MVLSGGLVELFCRFLKFIREMIDGGSPQRIKSHANDLQALAGEFTKVLDQLKAGRNDLAAVWKQGAGRRSTLKKLDELITLYEGIIKQLQAVVPQLTGAAGKLEHTQQLFGTRVQAGSNRIASILATGNPGAKAAAAGVAASTTASLQTIISSFGKMLEALGVKGIGPLFDAVGQIAGAAQQMQSQTDQTAAQSAALNSGLTSPQTLPAYTQYPFPGQNPKADDNTWTPVHQPPASGEDPPVRVTITNPDGTKQVIDAREDVKTTVKDADGKTTQVEIDV